MKAAPRFSGPAETVSVHSVCSGHDSLRRDGRPNADLSGTKSVNPDARRRRCRTTLPPRSGARTLVMGILVSCSVHPAAGSRYSRRASALTRRYSLTPAKGEVRLSPSVCRSPSAILLGVSGQRHLRTGRRKLHVRIYCHAVAVRPHLSPLWSA